LFPFFRRLWRRTRMIVLVAASAPIVGSPLRDTPQPQERRIEDPRIGRLAQYFRNRNSPLEKYAREFVVAAEANGLDWRLLPSIATIESGAGVYARANNVFGWKSGRARFHSIPAAIQHVAQRLAYAPHYNGRGLREKLRIYNPARPAYADCVLSVLDKVGPRRPILAAAAR